ncbi:MAG: DUF554 domain-containing protein [Firmicutes bacterium]|nr:DUF554 domain-containing protein [Bacillota bacterium]
MWGTIVNAGAVIIGGMLGVIIGQKVSRGMGDTLMKGISLAVILIGLQMALTTQNILIVIGSLVAGGTIGELLEFEGRLEQLGKRLEEMMKEKKGNVARAFVTSSLIYCVGAMAIVGSLESGLHQNYQILYAKSILDGISAVVFASTMGLGVVFSAGSIFIYQGGITLLAGWLQGALTQPVITEMSATGGLLIMGIGFNMLNISVIKVGNLLPAILVAALLAGIFL